MMIDDLNKQKRQEYESLRGWIWRLISLTFAQFWD